MFIKESINLIDRAADVSSLPTVRFNRQTNEEVWNFIYSNQGFTVYELQSMVKTI